MSRELTASVTEFRNHFGKFLKQVQRGDERIVVEKSGTPVAVLINIKEYEQFRRWLATRGSKIHS